MSSTAASRHLRWCVRASAFFHALLRQLAHLLFSPSWSAVRELVMQRSPALADQWLDCMLCGHVLMQQGVVRVLAVLSALQHCVVTRRAEMQTQWYAAWRDAISRAVQLLVTVKTMGSCLQHVHVGLPSSARCVCCASLSHVAAWPAWLVHVTQSLVAAFCWVCAHQVSMF